MKVLKFSATWCAPCKMLSAMLKADEFKNIEIEEIDVDDKRDYAISMGVRNVPTLIVMDGDVEQRRTTGSKTKQQLMEFLGL